MKSARQEILDKLKTAIHVAPEKPDDNAPVYPSIKKPLEIAFTENLEKVNGSVHLFPSENELYSALKTFLETFNPAEVYCNETAIQKQLTQFQIPFLEYTENHKNIEVGITGCEFLIAHTGSAMVSSAQKGGRQLFVYPPVHVIVARKSQIVDCLESAYSAIQNKYPENLPSQITIITGPSRTADIEKTLVMGAHGPKELRVFITS